MANTKISALPTTITIDAADSMPLATTSVGSPATKRITKGNLESQFIHQNLSGAGTNTHAQIDTAITASTAHIAATGTAVHGLGTMSTQAASAVAITGGTIAGATITGTTISTTNTITTGTTIKTPMARAYNSAVQAIANNSVTTITFDSERWDTDAIHSTSVNTSRLTCKTAGVYTIGAHIGFAANSTGIRNVYIYLNGTTYIAINIAPAVNGDASIYSVTTDYELAVNDYVEAQVLQTSGGSLNTVAAVAYSPEFWMKRTAPPSAVA